jgi:AbrB family looped-hinge helix DNA binding protein
MNAIVEIDKAGRIVVPKKLRDELHLTPGTRLRIERAGGQLVLEQDYPEPHLEMRGGLLVMVGGPPSTDEGVVEMINEQREQHMRFVSGLSDEP